MTCISYWGASVYSYVLPRQSTQCFRVVRAPASQLISARTSCSNLSPEPELKETDGEEGIDIILNEANDVATSGMPLIYSTFKVV